MPGQVTSIVQPGASLITAARPLAEPKRALGKYDSQWLFPGPNAKGRIPNGIVPLPPIVFPNLQSTASVMQFQVPEGYRFVLCGILMATNAATYSPGTGLLNFTLQVLYSTGPRGVEDLSNLDFCMGVFIALPGNQTTLTQPLKQRLEFSPLDVLEILVVNNPPLPNGSIAETGGIPTPAPTDVVIGMLEGFLYPNAESA